MSTARATQGDLGTHAQQLSAPVKPAQSQQIESSASVLSLTRVSPKANPTFKIKKCSTDDSHEKTFFFIYFLRIQKLRDFFSTVFLSKNLLSEPHQSLSSTTYIQVEVSLVDPVILNRFSAEAMRVRTLPTGTHVNFLKKNYAFHQNSSSFLPLSDPLRSALNLPCVSQSSYLIRLSVLSLFLTHGALFFSYCVMSQLSQSQILSINVCKCPSLLGAHVLFSYVSAHMSNDESETFGHRSYFCPAPTSIQYATTTLCSI